MSKQSVAGRIMPSSHPEDVHILITRTCEYVGFCGRKELKIQMESNFLIGWPSDGEIILAIFLVGATKSQGSL